MKTQFLFFAMSALVFTGCQKESDLAFPQKSAYQEAAEESLPETTNQLQTCISVETLLDMQGTITILDADGMWFGIEASGTLVSGGMGTCTMSFTYHLKSKLLDGSLDTYFKGGDELHQTFQATVYGGQVTLHYPVFYGTLSSSNVEYYMTEGTLTFDLPAMQEGSTTLSVSTSGIYCTLDGDGDGCLM